MPVTIEVPEDYGYVVATTAFTFFLGLWHGARARPFRTKVKIWAPKAYADTADIAAASTEYEKNDLYLFNCAQRAHANYVENQPSTAIALLLAGLKYPRLSAILGACWIIGRIIFAIGYTQRNRENGSGRLVGFAIQFPMQLSLWALAAWTGIQMLP